MQFCAVVVLMPGCDEAAQPASDDAGSSDDDTEAPPAEPGCTDADGDGAPSEVDCDDADPAAHPGTTEVCGDGIDNDCDGLVDLRVWYPDADGDGFGAWSESILACEAPTDAIAAGGDCDDRDAAAHPGAEDSCGDAVDSDCDGADGSREICGDGIDQDCDGTAVGCRLQGVVSLAAAHARLLGGPDTEEVGHMVLAGGDLDGDGVEDIVFSAPYVARYGVGGVSAVCVVLGPVSGEASAVDAAAGVVFNWADYSAPGWGLAGGKDLDNDGQVDLVLEQSGIVWVVSGLFSGGWLVSDLADWSLSAAPHWMEFPTGIVAASALLEGSSDDLVVYAHGASVDGVGDDVGAVGVFNDFAPGTYASDAADVLVYGERAQGYIGTGADSAGDMNGDGCEDLVIGAAYWDDAAAGDGAGAAFVVYGPRSGRVPVPSSAGAMMVGTTTDEHAGHRVRGVGDVDQDGFDDVLVATAPYDITPDRLTNAYLIRGPVCGTRSLASADARFESESPTYPAPLISIAPGADLDGDGATDIVLGVPSHDEYRGGVFVFYGPIHDGVYSLSDADLLIEGEAPGDVAGASVDIVGDQDGDGRPDILIGAPGFDSGRGAVYVVGSGGTGI
ncbi:hypothetical protein L6R50_16870 [Myxococcota bacterium]|nr:hypothetical protein [Myxococcota bacterium]